MVIDEKLPNNIKKLQLWSYITIKNHLCLEWNRWQSHAQSDRLKCPTENRTISPIASLLPSFNSFGAANTSFPGAPLRRKLMVRFVVTARPAGPIADKSTTYLRNCHVPPCPRLAPLLTLG